MIWIALGEDSYEIDILPRIVAAEGDTKRVKYLERGRLFLSDEHPRAVAPGTRPRRRRPDRHRPTRRRHQRSGSREAPNLDDDVTGDRPAEPTRRPARLHRDRRPAHHQQEVKGGSLAGILGSSDWGNVPRAVLALVRDEDDDGLRHIQVVAGNRVRGSAGRAFRIIAMPIVEGGEAVTVAVDFGDSDKDVDDLLTGNGRPERIDKQALQLRILAHLETGAKSREYLDELGVNELKATPDQVKEQGIEPLQEAEKITARKDGLAGGWSYALA